MEPHALGISYHAILPEIITAGAAILIMMVDAVTRGIPRRVGGVLALAACGAAAVAVVSLWDQPRRRRGATFQPSGRRIPVLSAPEA